MAMHNSDTAPLVLSKYERVQILASRVEQLLAGAPKLVDIDTDDVQRIAEEEIARRALPLVVARSLPNNKKRLYDLRDFIDPASHTMMPTLEAAPPSQSAEPAKLEEDAKFGESAKSGESSKLGEDAGDGGDQDQGQERSSDRDGHKESDTGL